MTVVVENLRFSYARLPALCDVSAEAPSGSITALIGPNASGKSTLLRCITGALKPNSGRALVDGAPVHSLRPRQIAQRLAYVPQRSIVSAAFTVRQVVELGRYALAPDGSAVDEAIRHLDLLDVADRPYPKLSVGQQQRVTLARALAQLGALNGAARLNRSFILDEPTSAMDLQHISMTVALLRDLAHRGVTVLVAMHDLSLAAAIADQVWMLDAGRMVAAGPVREVLHIDRLRQVFRADFRWIELPDGSTRLLSDLQPAHT